jgi:hypothetical protein
VTGFGMLSVQAPSPVPYHDGFTQSLRWKALWFQGTVEGSESAG